MGDGIWQSFYQNNSNLFILPIGAFISAFLFSVVSMDVSPINGNGIAIVPGTRAVAAAIFFMYVLVYAQSQARGRDRKINEIASIVFYDTLMNFLAVPVLVMVLCISVQLDRFEIENPDKPSPVDYQMTRILTNAAEMSFGPLLVIIVIVYVFMELKSWRLWSSLAIVITLVAIQSFVVNYAIFYNDRGLIPRRNAFLGMFAVLCIPLAVIGIKGIAVACHLHLIERDREADRDSVGDDVELIDRQFSDDPDSEGVDGEMGGIGRHSKRTAVKKAVHKLGR